TGSKYDQGDVDHDDGARGRWAAGGELRVEARLRAIALMGSYPVRGFRDANRAVLRLTADQHRLNRPEHSPAAPDRRFLSMIRTTTGRVASSGAGTTTTKRIIDDSRQRARVGRPLARCLRRGPAQARRRRGR